VRVGVSLPSKQYDEFARRAIRTGVSVPETIRQALQWKGEPKDQ
jgi:hypothetical protein